MKARDWSILKRSFGKMLVPELSASGLLVLWQTAEMSMAE